jgi:tetraacyldisaccharide 4'-kinase
MRVIERYSGRMRMFMGRGGWALLAPVRFVLSVLYGFHARGTPAPAPRGPGAGPKIISVGNIEVGGGGKTPCVLALASVLSARGLKPAVVTRGYGGRAALEGRGVIALPGTDACGDGLPAGYDCWRGDARADAALEIGDEAVLYLGAGLPLAVDGDRARGIAALTEAAEPTHIILDDAFHRTSLPKDLDILLLDAQRPFGNRRLLPYGTLREPAVAAKRAGAVIFTRASSPSVPEEAADIIKGLPVFFSMHVPVSLSGRGGEKYGAADLRGEKTVLFSGIARPESFEESAAQFGIDPSVSFRFDDHHAYLPEDIKGMIDECGSESVFVTTAKDWAKAAPLFREDVRVMRLDMEMQIEDMEGLLKLVL